MIRRGAGVVVQSVHHGDADLEAGVVERAGGFAIELCEGVPVAEVQVLEVELDPRVTVSATQLDHRLDGASAGGVVGQQRVEQVGVEPGVHDQRHDGHAVRPGQLEHPAIGLAPDHAVLVHLVGLRRDNGNVVDVPLQALEALELVHIVEQPLAPGLSRHR